MNKYFYALKTTMLLLVFGLLLGTNSVFAQSTVWTGNVDSDWANNANWNNGVPTTGYTATITGQPQGGNFPTYAGDPTIDYTIQNFGTITFNSFVYNEGMIVNFNGGAMISNNFFANAGEVFYNNDGRFDNNGIFENFGQFRNTAAATFNNASGAAVNNYGSFTNFGPVNNDGFWGNFGATFSSGTYNNFGTVDNRGTFDNGFGSNFNNEQNGTINNAKGQFLVNGILANNGQASISNAAELVFLTASDFNNQSSFTNQGEVSNSSKVFANNGTITNNGAWTNEDASNLENNNFFTNNGSIEHFTCAKWIQNASSIVTGTFLNEGGLVYEIGGQVDVTGGEFGYEFDNINAKAPPVPGCRAGVVVQLDENGQGSLVVSDIDKGAYGNCGAQIVTRTINPTTFTTADIGSKIVTLFIEDEFGQTATCDATVQVLEYVAPIVAIDSENIDLTCPTDIVLQTEPGADFVAAIWTEPTGTTNCNTGGTGVNPQPTCPGLVQNEGFENSMTGYNNWRNSYINTNTSHVRSGSKSIKIGNSNGGFGQNIHDIQGGVEYKFSAYAKKTSSQTEWAGIGINYYDANWNKISGKSVPITSHNFEQYRVTSTAPSNAVKAVIYAWKNGDSGRVYLDDLCFIGNTSACAPTNISGFVYMGEFNGSRYYCSQTSQANYQEALAGAVAAGGHLVTINNRAENDFIQSSIQYHSAWIGCTNMNSNDLYWTSGSSNYTRWKSGEPNEANSNTVGTRLLKDSGEWTDRTLGNRYEYVMEIECESPTDGPQVCDLLNFGTSDQFNEERLVWINFDNTNSPFEYAVRAGAKFQEFANGTATLTGKVDQLGNTGGYEFSVKLINKRDWAAWSALGRSYKLGDNNIDNHTQWSYYEVDNNNSAFTGFGANAGQTLAITHMPSDYEFGFQIGLGANDKDNDYGLSGWYTISGDRTGRGDFNADLGGCIPTEGNGDGNLMIEQIAGATSGSNFIQGTTQVAYRATDDCGNEEICVFDVTVERTPSEITITGCQENITVDAAPGAGSAVVNFTTPTGVSNCFRSSNVDVIRVDEGAASGAEFPVGQTFVGYVLTDSCGAVATCNFVITVNYVKPVLTLETCPGNFTATGNPVTWAEPTASSTCFTGLLKVEQVEGLVNGSNFPAGVTRVSYLIADECDNTAVCFFDVTVEEAGCTTPEIIISGAPEDTTVECDEIPAPAEVIISGGCGVVNVTTSDELVGDNCFATLTRTWIATDEAGTVATTEQKIIVADNTTPVLSGVPADKNHPKGQTLPVQPTVTAADNCDTDVPVEFTETQNGDQIIRTWTGQDDCGNIAEETQVITLIDDTTPCADAGTTCDDGDASTENDVEDGNCNCAGTPISQTCDLGFNVANIACDDNGTETQPNDDQFTFNLTIYNLSGGTNYTVSGTSYEYGVEYVFGPFPIANGTASIVIYDAENSSCSDVVTVDAPAPCTTLCDIFASAENVICNDNGTPSDSADDTFTFDLIVTGEGNPWAFMVGDDMYTYDDVHAFGPFAIIDGDVNIAVIDKDNPTCTDNITVSAPATCSDQPVDNCGTEVLFIVGNPNLSSGDLAAKQRLDNLGLNVTLVDDNVCQTSDADGKDIVIISSSVSSGYVKAKYRDITIPVVTWEVYLYDDMKMTNTGTNTSYGKYDTDDELEIIATGHPIASGLSGITQVFNAAKRLSWGKPATSATVVATIPNNPDLAAIFAYEAGDKLVNGTDAPARRVGLWLVNGTPVNLASNGGVLFDNAISYALGCTPQLITMSAAPKSMDTNIQESRGGEEVENTTETVPSIQMPIVEVADNQIVNSVTVFPNPATTFVNVDLNAFQNEAVDIRIFDQTARLVQQVQIAAAYGKHRIDFNDLIDGMYLIQVRSGETVQTKKLIVKR